ncbi:hypothetical protein ATN83_2528 [Raoultella ornithinolytica]|nr:hypothetical protein [Raoultella ornithinolytica]AMJ33733.1 putative protein [uncultured bacterium]ALQ46643.1 hypothetical protein ATN83_2528 [Raoultella ornithinolytica]AMJ33849.1 putative protein [uncultured bacterium]AMJ33870.1 putative protein [uncultured bacterium]AMJ33927.1 putative protein [uncultured bacterium]
MATFSVVKEPTFVSDYLLVVHPNGRNQQPFGRFGIPHLDNT